MKTETLFEVQKLVEDDGSVKGVVVVGKVQRGDVGFVVESLLETIAHLEGEGGLSGVANLGGGAQRDVKVELVDVLVEGIAEMDKDDMQVFVGDLKESLRRIVEGR